MREFTVRPALNGWIVKIGCQEVVFTRDDTLAREMQRYIGDPEGVEREYLAKAVNKMRLDVPVPTHNIEQEYCTPPQTEQRSRP